jgi:large subunit ribosomal protein L21e
MTKGSNGYRRKSRGIKVAPRDRGKVHIKRYMKDFNESDRVSIDIDAAFQNIPHPRFQGRSGQVVGKQGRAYFVQIFDGSMEKKLLVNPEHLVSLK